MATPAVPSICQHLIRPLYVLGEQHHTLRGTAIRPLVMSVMGRLSRLDARAARHAFDRADASPDYLDADALPVLVERYRQGPQRWDKRLPADKAVGRATEVLRSVERSLPVGVSQARAVELACGDGRVAMHLSHRLAGVTGIDLSDENFSPDAAKRVPIRIEDAADLSLEDNSVDLVYTFDAFEHFSDPRAVLDEVHRVLKPGGVMYASFGPLWNSAFGPHQWGRIDVPYLHHLFGADDLDAYADANARRRLTPNVNRLPLAYFRSLFSTADRHFRRIGYVEKMNVTFADLIVEHPTCFCAKVNDFDELCVRSIEVTLKKR